MTKTIEFYYDFGSPNAYLVEAVLPEIARRRGAEIRRIPILLGGLFKATGNQSPMFAFSEVTGKLAYLRTEIDRFTRKHRVPFLWNPHFPVLTTTLMRGAIVAEGTDWEAAFRDAMYRHCWVEGSNMTGPEVFAKVLAGEGLPVDEIVTGVQDARVKARLFATTATAKERGAFGVPTLFVGEEMFFGKDALPDLEDALA